MAKSTLSQLEAGFGNPGLETLWGLATALGVQVTQLIAQPRTHVQVIRAGEGVALASEQANYAATLLAVCPAGVQRDLYRIVAQPGSRHVSEPHCRGRWNMSSFAADAPSWGLSAIWSTSPPAITPVIRRMSRTCLKRWNPIPPLSWRLSTHEVGPVGGGVTPE